jgi:hypothetical protein
MPLKGIAYSTEMTADPTGKNRRLTGRRVPILSGETEGFPPAPSIRGAFTRLWGLAWLRIP